MIASISKIKSAEKHKSLEVEWTYDPPIATVLLAGSAQSLVATCKLRNKADRRNYRFESNSVKTTIDVSPFLPSLEWETPEPMVFGTALSDLQLSCRLQKRDTNIEGTFVYAVENDDEDEDEDPIDLAGTVLPAGRHRITARFFPLESGLYSSPRIAVWVQVNKRLVEVHWSPPPAIAFG